MKVVLVNGSPHEKGCTFTALQEISCCLNAEGILSEIYWIGLKPLSGCIACEKCRTLKKCVFDDKVNEFREIATNSDGFIFGTPVHWAAIAGTMTCFMDRLFYSEVRAGNKNFYLKPAAAVVSARRAGTTSTFDQVNKYFTHLQMPIIASQYWNMVHGNKSTDVAEDLEGLQTMRTLARNMAFF
jgi:multimeric flavodoxin WrbA